MSTYKENISVSALNLDNDELLQIITFENTLHVNSPPSLRFLQKLEIINRYPI